MAVGTPVKMSRRLNRQGKIPANANVCSLSQTVPQGLQSPFSGVGIRDKFAGTCRSAAPTGGRIASRGTKCREYKPGQSGVMHLAPAGADVEQSGLRTQLAHPIRMAQLKTGCVTHHSNFITLDKWGAWEVGGVFVSRAQFAGSEKSKADFCWI